MTILITGAAGFVGRNLCKYLEHRHSLRLAVREIRPETQALQEFGEVTAVGDVCGTTDWSASLKGVRAIVHLANRAHVMRESAAAAATAYQTVNVDGTRRLAEQAIAAGVQRLVYVSSVKVLGERTQVQGFDAESLPAPEDPYGQSKLEAEQVLRDLAEKSGLEIVVLRPPLVYGPGVAANFLQLMHGVKRGIPLPLAGIHNWRSLIYVGNLASAIEACLIHPAAAGKTYLVSDGEPVSTAQLVAMLAAAGNLPDRSWPMSPWLLRMAGMVVGKSHQVARLLESLVVDDSAIRRELAWMPPYSMVEGLRETMVASRREGG